MAEENKKEETPKPKTDKPTASSKPATFLVNARYELPRFGGIPYPPNLHLFGFVTFRITEAKAGAGLAEKVVLKHATKEVEALGHKPAGLVVESFSKLPDGWKK